MHTAIKNSSTFHFADDTYLKYSSTCENNLRKKMNEDLSFLFQWLCANRLSLNVAKTEFIIFKPARKNNKKRITLRLNGTTIFESKKLNILDSLSMIVYPGDSTFTNSKKNSVVSLEYFIVLKK